MALGMLGTVFGTPGISLPDMALGTTGMAVFALVLFIAIAIHF